MLISEHFTHYLSTHIFFTGATMKRILPLFSLILLLIIGISCTKVIQPKTKLLPDWYLNPPHSDLSVFGVGEATGQDMGLTRLASDARARDEIARQVNLFVSNLFETSMQSVDGKIDSNVVLNASRQVVSEKLQHVEIKEREVVEKDGGYVFYSLAEMSHLKLRKIVEAVVGDPEVERQLQVHDQLQQRLQKQIDGIGK
jgi:hypothetical protein